MNNNIADTNHHNNLSLNNKDIGIDLLDASDSRNYYFYSNSPFYIGDNDKPSNNLSNIENKLTPFTLMEKKYFKVILLALILILGMSLIVFPASKVGDISGELFSMILFGIFMPYIFLREIVFYIKNNKSQ